MNEQATGQAAASAVAVQLPAHLQRVLVEKRELDTKLDNLTAFFGKPAYKALDPAEQARLRAQHMAMQVYSGILGQRISAAC